MAIPNWEQVSALESSAFAAGRDYEQERIIKLLEHMPRTDNDRTVDAPTLIALIKEKK